MPESSTPPAVILLDVLGTLVYDPFYVELPAFLGLSFEELMAQKHPTAWIEFEAGRSDEETFLRRFFEDGRAYDRSGLKRCMEEAYRWLDGMEELLAELGSSGAELHALSNYPIWYRLIEERLGLSRYLPWSFVSCHLGLRKPAPEIFDHAVRELGVTPSACVFVDDREENCRAAAAQGLRAVRFRSAETLRRELATLGVL